MNKKYEANGRDQSEFFKNNMVYYRTASGNNVEKRDGFFVKNHAIVLTGLLPNTKYYYVVNSTDQSGNSNESIEYSFTTTQNQNIKLQKGWNLIGWTSANTIDIDNALSSLDWSAIGTYENEVWKSYVPEYGGSLKSLETGKGYFILMNQNGTLSVYIHKSIIELQKGWNLIGWTGASTTDIDTALSGLDWTAIGTNENEIWESYIKGYGGSLTSLKTGYGYFIQMNTSGKLIMG
ncbi:MAG: fibronectin type III domain-containing protein [Methanosarcinales archaeon]